MCPHGGQARFVPTNSKVLLGGQPALTSNDVTTVTGCPFMVGLKAQPCVLIRWIPGTSKLSAGGTQVLTMESKGICSSAEQIPQGPALIVNPGQMMVTA